jgi:hypothetical protein
MVKVMKSFAILTISKLCHVCAETIASLAYFGRKIFEARCNIFGKHFYYLVKILGKVGENMTTPPPPPNVDVFTTSLPPSPPLVPALPSTSSPETLRRSKPTKSVVKLAIATGHAMEIFNDLHYSNL